MGCFSRDVNEVYNRPLTCLCTVQDLALEYHGGRPATVQRYTKDTALFSQQSGALAVGQPCGFSVRISTFRDNDPDVTGVTIGTDEGSLGAAAVRSCGDRAIYQDGWAEAEGVGYQAAFYQGINVYTCDSFCAASFPCTLQQTVMATVDSGTPKILARSVAELATSDYGVVQIRGGVAPLTARMASRRLAAWDVVSNPSSYSPLAQSVPNRV